MAPSLKRFLDISLWPVAVAGLLSVSGSAQPLPQDTGAAGAWQRIQKLRTIASVMHTTAHPDDEHGGALTWLSRGLGAHVALLTLTRGESGDNAIGAQLFDALGLIRTEELLVADRYYGVNAQYFTAAIDYGFSKRLDEALDKWGREHVLGDVVRIIRTERPFVLVSRFQGNERDGHGNHQAAGLITIDAFRAAGDPKRFPEQIAEGLRPWQPRKVYIGGVRENESWNVVVDPGEYSPWLGMSYADFARIGLSYQRSQNSGRLVLSPGPQPGYYRRADAGTTVMQGIPSSLEGARENGFFDGISTSIVGLFLALQRPAPANAAAVLRPIADAVDEAVQRFTMVDPSASVPALARGLTATRAAIDALQQEPDAVFILRRKERQFMEAINAAMGVALTGVAQPAGTPEPPAGGFGAPPPLMGPVVPGQTFDVRVTFVSRGAPEIVLDALGVDTPRAWTVTSPAPAESVSQVANEPATRRVTVTLPADAPYDTKPYFTRRSIQDAHYTIDNMSQFGRASTRPPAVAFAQYRVNGVSVGVRETVQRREARLPYGYILRELNVVPAIAVMASPSTVVVPITAEARRALVQVEVLNNRDGASTGEVTLKLPPGWSAEPARVPFTFARAGERATHPFTISMPSIADRVYQVEAVAVVDGREYREGYETIEQRDLESRQLYRAAVTDVRGLDVRTVPGLAVGYVMGVGDQVPDGIRQLGYTVTLLGEGDLARGDLSRFDAIMTGTRAYAVRADLRTYNQRLLDYVERGGNLIVLYNTQELVPAQFAPRPGELTARAEEVSEEDSPVEILAPGVPMLTTPNAIGKADFTGWVEQRGSKFWSQWDPAYRPIIATWDRGQPPQHGGWLWTRHGKGHYTYFAYALHRQLPYGVPGAYKLLANLLALGRATSDQQRRKKIATKTRRTRKLPFVRRGCAAGRMKTIV